MADINLREIEIFLSVAKNQNISRTAQELYISQPSISNWISKMEADCGVELFRRTNRGAILTPDGEQLYARLDVAYNRFRVSVEEICRSHANDRGTLRVGCLNRLATMRLMEEKLRAFSAAHPEIPVSGERFNFHELRDKLLCRELDLIITLSSDIEPYDEFDARPMDDFPLFFLIPPSLEKRLSALSGRALIVEAPTSRHWAETLCRRHGVVPSGVRYVNSYILLATLVAREEGFAVDGRIVTDKTYLPSTDYCPVATPHDVKIVLAWARENVSPLATRFITFCSGDIQASDEK